MRWAYGFVSEFVLFTSSLILLRFGCGEAGYSCQRGWDDGECWGGQVTVVRWGWDGGKCWGEEKNSESLDHLTYDVSSATNHSKLISTKVTSSSYSMIFSFCLFLFSLSAILLILLIYLIISLAYLLIYLIKIVFISIFPDNCLA